MWKEKKTRTVKLEKHDADTCPMMVGNVKKCIPRMRAVRSKEKTTATATCETSGNVMRLCVNLMPALAAAKEPVEEEEDGRKEEDSTCPSKKESETSSKNDPFVTKSVEQTLNQGDPYKEFNPDTDAKQPFSPLFVLPPVTQPKLSPECCDRQKAKRCHTPLPPITFPEQTRTTSSNSTIQGCRGDELVTGQESESRPWIDNPLFSKSRSAEFRLPDISLSSLDALLHTVTQKLGRRKRRGFDEGPWRHVQSNHLLVAVTKQHLREKVVKQQIDDWTHDRNPANMEAITETSVCGRSVNRQRSLPPYFTAPKPTLLLSMTKKNPLTSNTLQ